MRLNTVAKTAFQFERPLGRTLTERKVSKVKRLTDNINEEMWSVCLHLQDASTRRTKVAVPSEGTTPERDRQTNRLQCLFIWVCVELKRNSHTQWTLHLFRTLQQQIPPLYSTATVIVQYHKCNFPSRIFWLQILEIISVSIILSLFV